MSAHPQLTLPPVTLDNATPKAREVLENARKQVGFIPNMYANMAHSPGLLETYLFGYNQFRKSDSFTAAEQEVILLTISRKNGCHYCVAAHSFMADNFSGVPVDVTNAIRDGREIPDARLRALSIFTKNLVVTRGQPNQQELETFIAAGFSEQQVLEILLAVSVKTISNYTNHLFNTPIDEMFKGREWHPA